MDVEDAFGLRIPNADAERLATVGDLWAYLVERTGATSPAELDAVWARLADLIHRTRRVPRERIRADARIAQDLGID